MLNKQAKTLTPKQTQRLLDHVGHTRYPDRNRVIVLLSFKGGCEPWRSQAYGGAW